MGRQRTRDDEGRVSPTARWMFRGVWTFFFVVFLVLVAAVVVTLVVRAVT